MGAPLHVLVAGGGVAALEAVLALDALAGGRVELELLAPSDEFVERPSSVLSPFTGEDAPHVQLDRLPAARRRGALAAVEPEAHSARTTDGSTIGYDRLIVAPGARPVEAVPGATLFRGPLSAGAVERTVRSARERVLFILPPGAGWALPVYELALLAAETVKGQADVAVVTPEQRPLELFGRVASDALTRVLDRAGVDFIGGAEAVEVVDGNLLTRDGRMIGADAAVALPHLRGPSLAGLPMDEQGFIPIDAHARVVGVKDVFAAGDGTDQPIKQGGLAAQQADAAAAWIAAETGARVFPRPFRRVLRGVVLTGEAPLFVRRDLDADEGFSRTLRDVPDAISRAGRWWPPGKIAGRYLTGFLAGEPGQKLSDRPRERL
jgi:sulfide:quinone oxidoreductase